MSINKLKNKLLAMCISTTLVLSCISVPIYAQDEQIMSASNVSENQEQLPDILEIAPIDGGQTIIVSGTSDNPNSRVNVDRNKIKKVMKSEFDNIYVSEAQEYFEYINTGAVLPVNMNQPEIKSAKDVESISSSLCLTKEVTDYMLSVQSRVDSGEIESVGEVVIFTPVKPSVNEGTVRTTSTSNVYTYNNTQFYDYLVYYTNVETNFPTVTKGSNTKIVADNVINGLLTVGGVASKTVGLVGTGISLLQSFIGMTGSGVIYGSTEDCLKINHVYDSYSKWTYGNSGGDWLLGYYGQKAKISKVEVYQYYFTSTGGKRSDSSNSPNVSIAGPYYEKSYVIAYSSLHNGWSESVLYDIPGTGYYIMF